VQGLRCAPVSSGKLIFQERAGMRHGDGNEAGECIRLTVDSHEIFIGIITLLLLDLEGSNE
jgi:hypothetical protein